MRTTPGAFLPILLGAVAALSTACVNPSHTGFAHIEVSTAASAIAIDHITLQVLSGATVVATHALTPAGGIWQATLSDLPAGNYGFQADAYATPNASSSSFTGSAAGVAITANNTTLVALVLHQTATPLSVVGPVIGSVTASTETPLVGQSVQLVASASGTGLSYLWSAGAGSFTSAGSGLLSASGSSATWFAPGQSGSQQLTITVTDSADNVASLTFALEVIAGEGSVGVKVYLPPQITSISGAQHVGNQAAWQLSLAVTAPPDNVALAYAWTKDVHCPSGSSFSDPTAPQPQFNFGAAGICTLTVTVSDPNLDLAPGPYPFATANLTLTDGAITAEYAPSITLGAQSLTVAAGHQLVLFDVTAVDHNSPPQSLTTSWLASDGSPTSLVDSPALSWTAPACLGASGSSITATVSNGHLSTSQVFTVLAAPGAVCP